MSIYKFQRAHYLIQYPEPARPVFIAEDAGTEVSVVDCCETGIRYRPIEYPLPEIGTPAKGIVRFKTGYEVSVAGTVVRIQDREVALHLTDAAIPWRVMLEEQLFLRKRYSLCA